MTIINKAAGIIIENRKLLIEKSENKEFFIAPGGTIEEGEETVTALIRELKEEFTIDVQENDLEYFGSFEAEAAGREDTVVKMEVYVVKNYTGQIKPDHEVEEILWADVKTSETIKVGSIFAHEVIPRLKELDLID